MSTESTLELLHQYHEAWGRGDREAGIAFFAEDIVVHMGGRGRISGDYRGRDAFVSGWIDRVADYTDSWIVGGEAGEAEILLAAEDGVVLMVHEIWTRGEKSVATDRIGIYKFAGGQITECWFSDMDQAAVDAFFAEID